MAFVRRRTGDPVFRRARSPAVVVGLGLWVFRDARRRIREPILVLLATFVGFAVPYIGAVVYLVFRPSETLEDLHSRRIELQALEQQLARPRPACPVCSSAIVADYTACSVCTTMLRDQCARCHAPVDDGIQLVPHADSHAWARERARFPAPFRSGSTR